jgi:hypothetical protein
MKPHYFSLEEANSTLVIIRPLMEEIQSLRSNIMTHQPEIWPAIERSAGNGGNPTLSKLVKDFQRLDDLFHRILATGAQVKDINTGLLDFPAWRKDHEVYLCWKYGEGRIEFWHEIEAGFAGRKSIDEF